MRLVVAGRVDGSQRAAGCHPNLVAVAHEVGRLHRLRCPLGATRVGGQLLGAVVRGTVPASQVGDVTAGRLPVVVLVHAVGRRGVHHVAAARFLHEARGEAHVVGVEVCADDDRDVSAAVPKMVEALAKGLVTVFVSAARVDDRQPVRAGEHVGVDRRQARYRERQLQLPQPGSERNRLRH